MQQFTTNVNLLLGGGAQVCACVQAKAAVPKPAGDLKSKIKSTPSATMGLMTFELADLQGQNNQSDNYPSPGKGYQAGKPSETIGAIPDKVTHHAAALSLHQVPQGTMHQSVASCVASQAPLSACSLLAGLVKACPADVLMLLQHSMTSLH